MKRVSNTIKIMVVAAALFAIIANIPNFVPERLRSSIPFVDSWSSLSLGLDLQGGAYLLLQLNDEELLETKLNLYANDFRRELFANKIKLTNIKIGKQTVTFQIADEAKTEEAREILRDQFSFLSAVEQGRTWKLTISDQRINEELAAAVSQSLEVVRNRIDETGTKEPQIYRQGKKRIVVALPGDQNPDRIKQLLGKTANLTFQLVSQAGMIAMTRGQPLPAGTELIDGYEKSANGQALYQMAVERRIYLTGEHLIDARPSIDQNGQPIVQFRLDTRGSRSFENLTRANVGQQLAVLLDNQVISSPNIREPIGGGTISIEGGNMTIEEAQDLALLMRSGALPVSLEILEERTVGPALGSDSIESGLQAIWLGIILVIAYIILVYARFGIYAAMVLGMNMLLLLAVITTIGGTLTLPGMAGLVLTVGMMVDANVLIYERIRDEYYHEHNRGDVALAVENGFKGAISSILDSNLTTLLAALILVGLGSGPVRGFALTLSVGILTSLFTCLLLTRWLITAWLHKKRHGGLLPY